MASMRAALVVAAAGFGSLPAGHAAQARANPIRKVVTMLQAMQEKVAAEGEAEEALYKKFACYCKTSGGELGESIAAAEAKGPSVSSEIQEADGQKSQLEADLKAHKADREAAKTSVAEATSIREKEAAAYAALKAEESSNIEAIEKAVAALEKGMAGGFLQTTAAQVLRKLTESRDEMADVDRQAVLSFLSGEQASGYAPKSGEITGILKQIGDEMAAGLSEATAAEKEAAKMHEGLVAAKSKEIAAHTKAIEEKSVRVGELGVSAAQLKNDLEDTQESLASDKAFLAELEKGCSTKETDWAERQKTRSEELVALAETIKLLNDDDALELFKHAVPVKGESFVQVGESVSSLKSRAMDILRAAGGTQRVGLDFIALALRGKAAGFEKVTAMIDEMVELLKGEQDGDDQKKEYCGTELDRSDDKKKGFEKVASDEEMSIASAEEAIAKLTEELKALSTGIAELDKSVAQATEQRKAENEKFTELMALDSQAKDLLHLAKNRLTKFYNPKLYNPPPKEELTKEQRIYESVAGPAAALVQIAATHGAAPLPPPETFDGAYAKKGQESTGVIAMVDLILKDLDKEMTEAETEEKDAQKDYEAMLTDAKVKRAADAKAVTGKEGTKADVEAELDAHREAKASAGKELAATVEYIAGLHADCDWLLQYYDVRKEARAGEVDSLGKAKAVLAGADYSFLQVREQRLLRGGAGRT